MLEIVVKEVFIYMIFYLLFIYYTDNYILFWNKLNARTCMFLEVKF